LTPRLELDVYKPLVTPAIDTGVKYGNGMVEGEEEQKLSSNLNDGVGFSQKLTKQGVTFQKTITV
jgi:hypothetical protein